MTVATMATSYPWHVWPGRHWPATAQEERQLVAELIELCGEPCENFDRGDLTAMLNALRCGVTVVDVLESAPGLDPARMLAAYEHLEGLRATAVDAWTELMGSPTISALAHLGPIAAQIMPMPVYRLATAAARNVNPAKDQTAAKVAAEVQRVGALALSTEAKLYGAEPPCEESIRIGRELYNPYVPGLWGDPFYLPVRVGVLMPIKVCDLLQERRR